MSEHEVIECLETTAICRLASVNRSTLDYWVRTGLVTPALRREPGRRRTRLWDLKDAIIVRTIAELRVAGCPLQQVRRARDVIVDSWTGWGPDAALVWTGDDVLRIDVEGHVESLVKQPLQQVLRLVVLPLGLWRESMGADVMYIRTDQVDLGVPRQTAQQAREAS